MAVGRRDFLRWSAAGCSVLLSPLALPAQQGIGRDAQGDLILGGGGFADPETGAQRYVFSRVDLASLDISLVDTEFLPHGIAIDPLNSSRLILFQKIGGGCCELDLGGRKVTRVVPPHEGRWFYGHGAFSTDGKLLYSTETVNAESRGVIGVRDAATLDYLGEFPTYGENPHDCHLIDGGKVLLVTNGGGALGTRLMPCVTYVDVASQRLLEKLELTNDRFNTGHATLSSKGDLVVVSAPRKGLSDKELGAVSMRSGRQPLRTMSEPADVTARMFGEALSTVIHEPTSVAAVTHPGGNMVTFWSTRSEALLQVLALPRARGVTLTKDGMNFILSYGTTTDLVQVPAASLAPLEQTQMTRTFLSGSHIFNWTRLTSTT